jgi:hypothetical protein
MRKSVIEVYPEGSFGAPRPLAKKLIEELFNSATVKSFNSVDNADEIRRFYDKHNYTILYDTGYGGSSSDHDEFMIFKESHPLFNLLVIRFGIRGSIYTNRSKIYTTDITLDSIRKFNDEMRIVVKNLTDYFYRNI